MELINGVYINILKYWPWHIIINYFLVLPLLDDLHPVTLIEISVWKKFTYLQKVSKHVPADVIGTMMQRKSVEGSFCKLKQLME